MKLLKFECVKFICHSPHCTHTHAPVIDKWKVVASISLLDRGPWNDCQVPGETFFFLLRFFQLLQSVDALFHGRRSADDERQKIHLSMARCPFVWPSGKCHSYGKQWPAEKKKMLQISTARTHSESFPHQLRCHFSIWRPICVFNNKKHTARRLGCPTFSGWKMTQTSRKPFINWPLRTTNACAVSSKRATLLRRLYQFSK